MENIKEYMDQLAGRYTTPLPPTCALITVAAIDFHSLFVPLGAHNQWLQEVKRLATSSTGWAIADSLTELETAILTGKKDCIVIHIEAGQLRKEKDLDKEVQHLMSQHHLELYVSERKWYQSKLRPIPDRPQSCGGVESRQRLALR